ncbi:MAG: hypothetical protein Tsb002_34230 [Wenzhouxiangellaceae bacterium]
MLLFISTVLLISSSAHSAALTPEAQRVVSKAEYRYSATIEAIKRQHDDDIRALVDEIDNLQTRIDNSDQAVVDLEQQLAQAQQRLVDELARRDRAYAQEIAVFRDAVDDIASTPEGLAALKRYNAGDIAGAIEILDELRAARDLARDAAKNVHSAADARLAAILMLEGRDRGEYTTQDVIKRYEEIVALDPRVHWDWVELTRLYVAAGQLQPALTSARQSLATSADDRDQSVAFNELGAIQIALGDLNAALQAFQQSYDILKSLADDDPSSASARRDLAVSLSQIGNVRQAQGDLNAALLAFQQSLAIAQRLADDDPSSASARHDLAVSLSQIGNVRQAQGDLNAALQAFQQSYEILQRLADDDPSSASARRDLAISLSKIGDVRHAQGDLNAALQAFQQSYEIRQRLADDDPSSAVAQRDLAVSLVKLASLGGSEYTWTMVAAQFKKMDDRGMLLPTDRQYYEEAKQLAAEESQ